MKNILQKSQRGSLWLKTWVRAVSCSFKVLQRFIFFVVYQSNYTSQDKKRIMSHKKSKTKNITWNLVSSISWVILDIVFAYKNFIHWNISKILISLWCFILWVILSLPAFIVAIVVGLLDPIAWSEIIVYMLSWSTDVSYQLIWWVAMYPYNLVLMLFIIVVWICLFLLWSCYALFLKAELSLWYTKSKKLKYSKNHYFNRSYILRFIGIICWSFTYMLAPVVIWVGLVFFMYLFYNIWFLGFDGLSIWIWIYTFILMCAELYLLYRIMFGYVLLADDTKKKHLKNSIHYVKKSIDITKWKSFLKFIVLYILFVLFVAPSTLLDNYLEQQWGLMRDAMVYNSGLLQNLEPEQVQYYEYISKEYSDLTNEELSSKLSSLAALRFMLYFASYLLVSGIFVLMVTSFYKRVLVKK